MAHIDAEEEVMEKHGSVGPTRPRGSSWPQPMRVHEATTEKKSSARQAPYEPKRDQSRARAREGVPTRHKFRLNLKELIAIPDVAYKLKPPPKTGRRLGPSKDTWCEFHLTLGHQLNELVKAGFLKEYLEENQEALTALAPAED